MRKDQRVKRGIDDLINMCTGAPCIPIGLLIGVFRRFKFHLAIHINYRHHFAHGSCIVWPGTVKNPTRMETYFIHINGRANNPWILFASKMEHYWNP
jgi:hypothetical protein